MSALELTRQPTIVNAAAALIAAAVAVAVTGLVSTNGFLFGAAGIAILATGLARGWRMAVDVGSVLLFFGVVAGGLEADVIEVTMIATVATVVAWDLGHGAIDLGDQLGRESTTARLEGVHVVSSLLVGLLSATAGYTVFAFAAGGQPAMAVVLLLVAACFVTIALGSTGTERAVSSRR